MKKCVFDREKAIKLFITLSTISTLVVVAALFFSNGALFSKYFFKDELDTGMDFFNSINYVNTNSPYYDYNTLYSPFTNLLYYFLYGFVKSKVVFPSSFAIAIVARGTASDLRHIQSILMVYIIYVILLCLMTFVIICKFLSTMKEEKKWLISLSVIFSFGYLYALERGNIIILSFINVIFFLMFYNSENKVIKELSLLSLAFAFGLKQYTAIVGLLLLKKKDYFSVIRCCTYAILVCVIPCFVFKEGLNALGAWIKCIIDFTSGVSTTSNTFANIIKVIQKISGLNFLANTSVFVYLIIFILLFFFFTSKIESQSVTILLILLIAITNQNNYIYIFYNVPILFMLKFQTKYDALELIEFIVLILLSIQLPIFNSDLYSSVHCLLTFLLLIMIFVNSMHMLKRNNDSILFIK